MIKNSPTNSYPSTQINSNIELNTQINSQNQSKHKYIYKIQQLNRHLKQKLSYQSWLHITQLLINNNANDDVMQIIAQIQWPCLKILNLYNNNIMEKGIKFIMDMKLIKLIKLQLNQNDFRSAGIKYLTKIYLPELQQLYLGWDHIGNQGCKHLSKGHWPNLTTIALGTNSYGIDGYMSITQHSIWNNLTVFWNRFNIRCYIMAVQYIVVKLHNTSIYLQQKNQEFKKYYQQLCNMKSCQRIN